jgi:hypothetical protein
MPVRSKHDAPGQMAGYLYQVLAALLLLLENRRYLTFRQWGTNVMVVSEKRTTFTEPPKYERDNLEQIRISIVKVEM